MMRRNNNRWALVTMLCVLTVVAGGAPAWAGEKENRIAVAVMDLTIPEDSPAFAMRDALSGATSQALSELGIFKVITMADVRRMLSYDAVKGQLGCDDTSCFAELGGALGVDYLITGELTFVGDAYVLQLQLVSIKHSRVDARVQREYQGDSRGLLKEVKSAAQLLVRDLMQLKAGTIAIVSNEEGASVRIDGILVGATPVAPQEIGGGHHTVEVRKEGFVRFARDVVVEPKAETRVDAPLQPSPEYIRAYTERASDARRTAWVDLGVGAAGVVGAVSLYVAGASKSGSLNDKIDKYNDKSLRDLQTYDQIQNERRTIAAYDMFAVVCAAVGAGALALGTFNYLTGDDPNRYDVTTSAGGPAAEAAGPIWQLGISPTSVTIGSRF